MGFQLAWSWLKLRLLCYTGCAVDFFLCVWLVNWPFLFCVWFQPSITEDDTDRFDQAAEEWGDTGCPESSQVSSDTCCLCSLSCCLDWTCLFWVFLQITNTPYKRFHFATFNGNITCDWYCSFVPVSLDYFAKLLHVCNLKVDGIILSGGYRRTTSCLQCE